MVSTTLAPGFRLSQYRSMAQPVELSSNQLKRRCDPKSLGFKTTAELPRLTEILGQPRAVAALSFGTSIASHGFNLFAMGQTGSGKTTLIREYLERRAAGESRPRDYCYVYNFSNPRCPTPLPLPAGGAVQFKKDIDTLVDELKAELTKAFDADEYSSHRDKVVRELEQKRREELERIEQHCKDAGFQLLKGPAGLLLVPLIGDKLPTEEDLEKLTSEEKERLARARESVQHEIEQHFRAIRDLERTAREAIRTVDADTAAFATRHLVDEVRSRYQDQPAVLAYLDAMQKDIVANADDLKKAKEPEPAPPSPLGLVASAGDKSLVRYQVNVLVDNTNLTGAPVVVESNPTYYNLTGRIEHMTTLGGIVTDHTMIKPGTLHRANGGYLIVPARECLMNGFAWEGLKRALKNRALRIEELGTQLGLLSTVSLDPEAIPLDTKVVLIGSPAVYHLLLGHDEDFQKLFKVKADFTTTMKRTAESEQAYSLFVNTIAQEEHTLPFDRDAVARIIDYGSRIAEDQEELTTRFGDIADLIREAAHEAGQNSHVAVTATDIAVAEDARRFRQNLVEERVQESFAKGTVLMNTSGMAVGTINGLSVLSLGDCTFGHPVRLSATVGAGRRGVVSIEREVELSGPIHGKGVLILSGYLTRQYGQPGPLTLSASLVFEQSYGMVEGDSASLAELCALLSAISETPLRQDISITGSINQHGDVQAIGGAIAKVEGYFDLCRARGLTGSQGVLLPASNRRHLMLRDDVVEAVREGQFHVWGAQTVDEALELLTGRQAGDVHGAVTASLAKYSQIIQALSSSEDRKSGHSGA
jgi:predicted ATP-dependent protease